MQKYETISISNARTWFAVVAIGLTIISAGAGRSEVTARPETAGLEFHVAVDGKDSNPGTAAAPLATLAGARDVVRAKVAAGLTSDVEVIIHGGVYAQFETLTFGPEDSGNDQYSITYATAPGDKVVLSGGRSISGWKPGAGGIWTTEIPEARSGQWSFRQLFVSGRRATRARTPNADAPESWWQIATSSANKDVPPAEDALITVKVSGPIQAYRNPSDVELVYMQNNEIARKRLELVDEQTQTFTLARPHRWNPKVFGYDWYLTIPFAGKRCYLENAREMLDQPGEWYLDRRSGVLSYWPLPGEDLARTEVVASVLQKTMLAVIGTPDRPVTNLHFKGLQVQHVEWPLPPWGYIPLFCCNVAVTEGERVGHQPIEAAVEYTQARGCSFVDGGITHVGGMGLCLRKGTAQITIEGNEVGDVSGGGIAAGWPNSAAGYLDAAPPPLPGEFSGYRIANNHVHHCGMEYFGAVGILLFTSHQSVVAHNLVHDMAYIGIIANGSQDPRMTFDGDNLVEYNHVHDAMTTTIDGAGIYVSFPHHGQGMRVRGNVVHDVHGNPYHFVDYASMKKWGEHPPSAGLYIDGHSQGGIYENNVLYRNLAAGPLIFNYADAREKNRWVDNIFAKNSVPPAEFLEAVEAFAGLEPAYRPRLLNSAARPCARYVLKESSVQSPWSAIQYDLPADGSGVVQIVVGKEGTKVPIRIQPQGLDAAAPYELWAYRAPVGPQDVWGGPDVTQQIPMLGETGTVDLATLGLTARIRGSDTLADGLSVKIGDSPQVVWIAYKKLN